MGNQNPYRISTETAARLAGTARSLTYAQTYFADAGRGSREYDDSSESNIESELDFDNFDEDPIAPGVRFPSDIKPRKHNVKKQPKQTRKPRK